MSSSFLSCSSSSACLSFLLQSLLLGLCNFTIYEPFFLRWLCPSLAWLQRHAVADNPGCLHVFDSCVISLLRTLPEPNNCNHVHTSVPLTGLEEDEVVVVRGVLPHCRMNSLSAHGNTVEVPLSVLLRSKKNSDGHETREFEVLLVREGAKYRPRQEDLAEGTIVLECKQHWTHVMLVMRNYLIEPGSVIYTPEVSLKNKGTVLRESERLVSGAAAVDCYSWSHRYSKKFQLFLAVNALVWVWNHWKLYSSALTQSSVADHVFVNLTAMLGGIVVGFLIRGLIFQLGKRRMNQIMKPEPNIVRIVDMERASQRSQPSQKHQYYMIRCNIPAGSELKVTAKIDEVNQLYWSLIFYDEYGVPLPQCVFDAIVNHKNRNGSKYEIDVRLKDLQNKKPPYVNGVTYLDIGNHRKGYILIRLVHPKDESVKDYSLPSAELIAY